MTTENPELSIPAIAKLANVSERTVHDWFDDGKIPVSRIEQRGAQRRRYAIKADVETFLASVQPGGIQSGEATSRPPNTPIADC